MTQNELARKKDSIMELVAAVENALSAGNDPDEVRQLVEKVIEELGVE